MAAIQNREDVNQLVVQFYQKVRQDELLGPIFNGRIPEQSWPQHLEKLTDFWETNLFGKKSYKGNPTRKHIEVDLEAKNPISQLHFHRWLSLWMETIDSMFSCERAKRAKDGARKIATYQFMAIAKYRELTTK